MDDIPESDDFIKDDEYGYNSQVGVEEYRIFFNISSIYEMKSSQWAVITVTGKTATVSIESNDVTKPPKKNTNNKLPTGGIIGIILGSIILLVAVVIVFFDTTTLINRFKSIFGLSKRYDNPGGREGYNNPGGEDL